MRKPTVAAMFDLPWKPTGELLVLLRKMHWGGQPGELQA